MKKLALAACVALLATPEPARAEEPADLLATVTTAHVLPSVRSAQSLVRKLSATTSDLKLEAMASVFFGLDAPMAAAFEGPIDLALLKGGEGSTVGGGAIAIPWKDPEKLRGIGAPGPTGVRSVPTDATPVLQQLAMAAGGNDAACALFPSAAPPGARLVCATPSRTLATLGPYLAGDVALEAHGSDVAVRAPMGPLVQRALSPEKIHTIGESEADRLAGDEIVAFGRDAASGALGLSWSDEALALDFDLRLAGKSATTTRLLLSADKRGRALPTFFERLPADSLLFGTLGGFDPQLTRELANRAVDAGGRAAGESAQLAVAMLRPFVDALASQGLAASLAIGLEAKRALPLVEAQKKKPTDAGLAKAKRALQPWLALEADGLEGGLGFLEAALKLGDRVAPLDTAKGPKWPEGARAWKLDDGSAIAALAQRGSLLVVVGAEPGLVSEKLRVVAGGTGARVKLSPATRDAFRDRPAAVFVVTDRLSDLTALSAEAEDIDATLKALRDDARRKDPAVEVPVTIAVKAPSEATAWQGSVRVEARYPVKALQAFAKGAKKLGPGGGLSL